MTSTSIVELSYSLDYMIDRAYNELKKHDKKKVSFIQPEVKIHNRKTYITNFKLFCEKLNRSQDLVNKYLVKELNCQTSFNNSELNESLKIDNIIRQNVIHSILTSFIKTYIICINCKSGNTQINKINRLYYLVCSDCNSSSSINLV
jgi:translation initiation factor 2 subunit 2